MNAAYKFGGGIPRTGFGNIQGYNQVMYGAMDLFNPVGC